MADGWGKADWHVFRSERSAIAEYDGKASRKAADALAVGACLQEWMEQHQGTHDEARAALAAMGITGATWS